jgi:electron transfer flavoprotein beta subunit
LPNQITCPFPFELKESPVKVAVLIKQTPDTAELPKVSADDVSRASVKATMVINPWDEFAAEEAILLNDRYDCETVAISMGSSDAVDALKHALAMGVSQAVLVEGSAGAGDIWGTAAALAAAVQAQGDVDVVLAGKQSVDDNSGAVYAGVASKLGYRLLSNVIKIVEVGDGILQAERLVDGGVETVSVALPVVVSVSKEINEPRYPSFMGIRKANKAEIPFLQASDLGLNGSGARTSWSNIRKPDLQKTQVRIVEGATVNEKAAALVDALLADKVL